MSEFIPELKHRPPIIPSEVPAPHLEWYWYFAHRYRGMLPADFLMFSPSPGWFHLVDEFLSNLVRLQTVYDFSTNIDQVKNKFGELVIYYSLDIPEDTPDDLRKKIYEEILLRQREAVFDSQCTCCRCGDIGEDRAEKASPLILCDSCHQAIYQCAEE